MEIKRRTQNERSAATRAALVAAARPLFAGHGFAAVGTEAIVRAAGVTRGALYHQFADKTELFAAVVDEVEAGVVERLLASLPAEETVDALTTLDRGVDAWLDACAEPEVQRIVLMDAPAVLGWERWRTLGLRHGLGLIEGALQVAMASGDVAEQPVRPLAHLLVSTFDEAALYVARASDPDAARTEMRSALRNLLAGLARSPGPGIGHPPQ
jgi:AcrR family transcriptional regulator